MVIGCEGADFFRPFIDTQVGYARRTKQMHYFLPVLGLLLTHQGLKMPSHEERSRINMIVLPIGVDVQATNRPAREVLRSLESSSGLRIARTDFPLDDRVSLNLINVPPAFAVQQIVASSGGKVVQADCHPYIVVDKSPAVATEPMLPSTLVTVDIVDADVRTALRLIFSQTNHAYTVSTDVEGKVTLRASRRPLSEVIHSLLEQVNVAVRVEGDVLNFFSAFKAGAYLVTTSTNLQAPVRYFLASGKSRQEALQRFARITNTSYVVDPGVDLNQPLSLLIQSETVESALSKIIGADLRFVVHESRFHISKR